MTIDGGVHTWTLNDSYTTAGAVALSIKSGTFSPANTQAALDYAADDAEITLAGGTYDKLWLRGTLKDTVDLSLTQSKSTTGTVTRNIDGLIIQAAQGEEVTVKGLEILVGGGKKSGDAGVPETLTTYIKNHGTSSQQKDNGQYTAIVTATDVTLDGLTFTGNLVGDVNSVDDASIKNWSVMGCTFTGCGIKFAGSSKKSDCRNLDGIEIIDCSFGNYQDSGAMGIYMQRVGNVKVSSCEFAAIAKNGISLNDYQFGDIVISENEFKNIGDRAIRVGNYTGTDVTLEISGNIFESTACDKGEGELIKIGGTFTSENTTITITNNVGVAAEPVTDGSSSGSETYFLIYKLPSEA